MEIRDDLGRILKGSPEELSDFLRRQEPAPKAEEGKRDELFGVLLHELGAMARNCKGDEVATQLSNLKEILGQLYKNDLRYQRVSLMNFIEREMQLLNRGWEEKVEIQMDVDEDEMELPIAALRLILSNLFRNAVEHGLGDREELNIRIEAKNMSTKMYLVFEDDGQGTDENGVHRFSAPFKSSKEERSAGHGLGGTIVTSLVEKLGGEIKVNSMPGKGFRVWMSIPADRRSGERRK